APAPAPPQLVRNATLGPPNPRGAVRGTKRRVTLTGNGVGRAEAVVFPEPGVSATILPREKPDPNKLDIEVDIAPEARVGLHRFGVRTPLGTPSFQTFAVSADPEAAEAEPNEDPVRTKIVPLPATLLGTIDRPGDLDHFRFEARAGQRLVFETLARGMGSNLDGSLAILDEAGHVLAESQESGGGSDPLLFFEAPRAGVFTLRVVDAQFGGSGNHFYRIRAGAFPYLEGVFPLGVEVGRTADIKVTGRNLGGLEVVPIAVPPRVEPGAMIPVVITLPDGQRAGPARQVVAAEGSQVIEGGENDSPAQAEPVAVPGGVSGRIGKEGDSDHFRFEAKKGQRLIVEVFGRRLGTPIDPVLEILDAQGRPIPRAVLRPVEETAVAFRDHPSTGRNIRLTQWNDFAVGDYVLIGRELLRLYELPRNPDDDAVFWGLGRPRSNTGERLALLETTPEHHPQGQPIYKVEIHPPGATFPLGGVPPVTIHYRNDDGGPGFGKDARLTFDPPADGTYIVRVEDARGMGGDRYGYHLVVRRPRPDFLLSLSTEDPNVPRGGTAIVSANIIRLDGFNNPVDVTIEDLPPGISATSARIEPDAYTADLLLMADPWAPTFSPPSWRVSARAAAEGSSGQEICHTLDPGGPKAGWITVTPEPNLKIRFRPDRLAIHPGERVELTFSVARSPAFRGRVPIEVRNLPLGVRVLNIGLNGVLVTESQTERTVSLYAEPWAQPTEGLFYAVGRCEPAGTEHSSPPIPLVVRPARPGPRESALVGAP
ncbi:MAG: PPC domain-containing protein, partial [Isosphaeraceae bacterium]|nr:PPC domain-containing protein [Isosphaeraceae bacterium]